MAEASREPGRAASLENELSCPICLCLYKDPVMLSCGHNFCRHCIQKVFDVQRQSQASYSCPVCKTQLGPILELQKNFQLCSIVETFLATNSKGQQEDDSEEGKKTMIPCDFCLDESQSAVKTCLMCDVSLCQAHVNKHNAKASQQDHVLVEVGTGSGAEERMCQEHGKLLECYCRKEGVYICVLCSLAGKHKGHDIITVKEAHGEQLGELSKMVTWLQERKQYLATELEELQKSKQQIKTNTQSVSPQLEKLFEEMETQIVQKKVKILSDIQSSEKKQLARISEVEEEIEKRRDEAVQHLQSLQQIREQPDVFRFFKEFKLIKDRTAGQNFSVSRMGVAVVQMDQARSDGYRRVTQEFLNRLDGLLQQAQRELDNQIIQYSGASTSSSQSLNSLKGLTVDLDQPPHSFSFGGEAPSQSFTTGGIPGQNPGSIPMCIPSFGGSFGGSSQSFGGFGASSSQPFGSSKFGTYWK